MTITFHFTEKEAATLVHVRSGLIELARDALYQRNDFDVLELVHGIEIIHRMLHQAPPMPELVDQ